MPPILVRPILPKRSALLDLNRIKAELSHDLDAEKQALLTDFRKTVATWDTPVDFGARKFLRTDALSINVYPQGSGAQIWTWVNDGTRAHDITPRGRYPLRFRAGHKARTRRGWIGSGIKLSYGATVHARRVHHPGTQARDFTGMIARKHRPEFRRLCENGLRRALR